MKHANTINVIILVLLLVGGLNWGLVGLFNFNLIDAIFGMTIARVVYVLVGIAAVWRVINWARSRG